MGIPERKVIPIAKKDEQTGVEVRCRPRQSTQQGVVEVNSEFADSTTGQLDRQRDGISNPKIALLCKPQLRSRNHKNLLIYLSAKDVWYTTNQEISDGIYQPYGTVREGLRKLESLGYIRKTTHSNHGLKIEVLKSIGDFGIEIKQASITGKSDKIDRLYNKSIYLSKMDIDRLWPKVAERGFHSAHHRQLVNDFEVKGFEISNINQALNFIEFQLSQNALVDRHGQPIINVPDYLLKALRLNGYYSRPRNYVSPEEQAQLDLVEEQERIRAVRLKAQKLTESNWWEGLPPNHPAKLDRMMGTPESWIAHQYKKYSEQQY